MYFFVSVLQFVDLSILITEKCCFLKALLTVKGKQRDEK